MQQFVHLRDVRRVRRRAFNAVRQAGFVVNPSVRLYPEVPLIALLRLTHLRVALAVGIRGRTRRRYDRRVNDRYRTQALALPRQVRVHTLEQLPRQIMCLQQSMEVESRRLVGNAVQTAQSR